MTHELLERLIRSDFVDEEIVFMLLWAMPSSIGLCAHLTNLAAKLTQLYIHTYIIHHFSGAPRGAFQQPVYNKCKVRWLRVLARPLQAVHNVFLSETLSCALS